MPLIGRASRNRKRARRWERPRLLELGDDGAVLTYRFTGRRDGEQGYEALMSSAYSRADGKWRLVLHQQTPIQGL